MEKLKKSKKITKENKKIIEEFVKFKQAEGVSDRRLRRIIITLKKYAVNKKSFKKFTQEDLEGLISEIRAQNTSEWTKVTEIKVFKNFFRWLKKKYSLNIDLEEIKVKEPKNKILPEYLLTEEELNKLLNGAEHQMKVLLGILYESGARISEILGLKIQNVSFNQYAARILVHGKTGQRVIPIVWFANLLREYIESHPYNSNPEAPLFYHITKDGRVIPLPYNIFRMRLKNLCKRVGIRKRIYAHLFRHSRLTELAKELPEQVLKKIAGWVPDSDMAQVYLHLSQKDVEESLLSRVYGIKVNGKDKEEKVRICPKCGEQNPLFAKICWRCKTPLDEKELREIVLTEEKIEEINKWSRILLAFFKTIEKKYPDIWEEMREIVKSTKNKREVKVF